MQKKITRKKFLQICRTVVSGGSILGVSGFILRKNHLLRNGGLGGNNLTRGDEAGWRNDRFVSPYRLVSSFTVPDLIEAFELAGDNLIVATSNSVSIYDNEGSLLNNFAVRSNLRDIATDPEHIYLLFPAHIEVYSHDGEWLREWEAYGESSDFCSMAVAGNAVFVTDAANKDICKFTTGGDFVKHIKSPNGFVIPSYTFGITCVDGVVYCSNSGRHQVEKYSLDGEYLGAFGKPGGAEGMFCGCCNPVHLTNTSSGDIITSEKGLPRISCYGMNGEFRSMLLDGQTLGGGSVAYDVKVHNDRLFVAGKNRISAFQYDKVSAVKSACSGCGAACPLRSS
jgi:hypothetical protein